MNNFTTGILSLTVDIEMTSITFRLLNLNACTWPFSYKIIFLQFLVGISNLALNQKWLSYTHFERRPNAQVRVVEGGEKCNISILTRFMTIVKVPFLCENIFLIFMTFDSKNYWLHDKLSAFMAIYYIYYVPKSVIMHAREGLRQPHISLCIEIEKRDEDVTTEIVSLQAP